MTARIPALIVSYRNVRRCGSKIGEVIDSVEDDKTGPGSTPKTAISGPSFSHPAAAWNQHHGGD